MRHLLTAVAVLLLGSTAAHAATVRIEGQNGTLLPRTTVPLTAENEPNTGAPGDSAAALVERGTNGNWDREAFTQVILGETHKFDNNDYWSFWVFRGGAYKQSTGVYSERIAPGEDLLGTYQISDSSFAPTIFPLWLTDVPAKVTAGVPFTVTANRTQCETNDCLPGEGQRQPAAGASVNGVTADAQGRATLTLTTPGPATLTVTQPNRIQDTATTTVEAAPVYAVPTVVPTPTSPAEDRGKPVSRIEGIGEQQRFRRARAPRELRATVTDASALRSVQLSLTRQVGRRCTAFDGESERFRRVRCGRHPRFGIGTDKAVSFLLPARLKRGRYVFDVVATDVGGNRESLARGRNRVVFRVR